MNSRDNKSKPQISEWIPKPRKRTPTPVPQVVDWFANKESDPTRDAPAPEEKKRER